jgi:hypothetical protein
MPTLNARQGRKEEKTQKNHLFTHSSHASTPTMTRRSKAYHKGRSQIAETPKPTSSKEKKPTTTADVTPPGSPTTIVEKMETLDIGSGKGKGKGKERDAGQEEMKASEKGKGKERDNELLSDDNETAKSQKSKKEAKGKKSKEKTLEETYGNRGWSVLNKDDDEYMQCLRTIAERIPGMKIVTFNGMLVRGNFDMYNDRILSMSKRQMSESFGIMFSLMFSRLVPVGSVIVRQFCDEIDPKTNLPWKIIYAFAISDGRVIQMPAHKTREACCTESYTGRRLPPEPSCRYC